MEPNPNINSLDRFRKQSRRLVLESYSHCEVPAGCGGVVMRWRDPFASVPVVLHLYTPAPAACFLDGQPLETMRTDLPPGDHVFAAHVEAVPNTAALVLFAVTRFPERKGTPTHGVQPPDFRSGGREVWNAAFAPPGDAWARPGFDDSAWEPLVPTAAPEVGKDGDGWYQVRQLTELGARCLGRSSPVSGPVWVRVRFTVAPAAEQP